MNEKRIESRTSRTAQMTCSCRAASYLETRSPYHSDDHVAVQLLPKPLAVLLRLPPLRTFFARRLAPSGAYEYVIARTKYVDAAFRRALAEGFDQVLLFGAGFDSRALRFGAEAQSTRVYELDAPPTQKAKIQRYEKLGLDVPSNLVFIAIDFDRESLPQALDRAGFSKDRRSLFVLEGLLMYLETGSVEDTFRTMQAYAGPGSRAVFDYVRASVLRGEGSLYGEEGLARSVAGADERWRFGIDPGQVEAFLAPYGFEVRDHLDARKLEDAFFRDEDGRLVGRVNGTHCIVTAERKA